MPNFSGVWNLKEQIQAVAAGTWTGLPAYALYAWGYNANGQLGDNTVVNKSSPVQIGASINWPQASAGANHSLGATTSGALYSWGRASSGQLGQNNVIYRSSPVQVGGDAWANFDAGDSSSIAIKTNGTLWSWGFNNKGQIGDNTRSRGSQSRSDQRWAGGTNWRPCSCCSRPYW